MKKILSIFSAVSALAIALSLAWFFLIGKNMKIESVVVVLDPQATHDWLFDDIKKDLEERLKPFHGESLLTFSLRIVSSSVLEDARIKNVFLRREFPSALRVQITPHEPVMGWIDKNGFIHPVARDNKILPGPKSERFQDFPLLRGDEFKQNSDLRQRALDFLSQLPEEGAFRKSLISEIRYRKASGFEVFLSEPSVLVKMGEGEIPEKSSRVQKVLSYMHSREINGRVIDSRFSKKVVVRLRNEP